MNDLHEMKSQSEERENRMKINELGTPESVVDHPYCPSCVFVVVGESAREEKLHDGGSRGRFHPDERGQTIAMNTHHDLNTQTHIQGKYLQ